MADPVAKWRRSILDPLRILYPEGGVSLKTKTYLSDMLEMVDRPAFCVSNGIITQANRAAAGRFVQIGDPIQPMLNAGQEEYRNFTAGCLYLPLTISGHQYDASVTKVEELDLFSLDPDDTAQSLHPLALAARELREPLNRILSITDDLFPQLDNDPQTHEKIGQINRGLYQMLRLVNNMSAAAAPLRPHLELRDVAAVAQELFDQASQLCAESGVRLNFTNHPTSIYALIDSSLLERGLYNMISNALKYTPAGGVIEARLTRRGSQMSFTVSDSGTGLDPAVTANVYRRYLREPALESVSQGIGLGMKLVRSAAAAHGGTVLLRQQEGGGVLVSMCLPIRQKTDLVASRPLRVDYAGERSPALIELSDSLPNELYAPHPQK